jgi:hypothetical protein
VIALATDRAEEMRRLSPLPLLDLNHPQDVAAFIVDYFGLLPNPTLFA